MQSVDARQWAPVPDQADLREKSIAGDGDHADGETGQGHRHHQRLVGGAEVDGDGRDDLDNASEYQTSLPSHLLWQISRYKETYHSGRLVYTHCNKSIVLKVDKIFL